MANNYIQPGDIIDFPADTDISKDAVVRIGNILGVAATNIPAGTTGSVTIRGVFTVPKVSGAVIAAGESLTWDASAGAFDDNAATPATGDVTGPPAVAIEAAGSGVTSLSVLFTGVPGTVA